MGYERSLIILFTGTDILEIPWENGPGGRKRSKGDRTKLSRRVENEYRVPSLEVEIKIKGREAPRSTHILASKKDDENPPCRVRPQGESTPLAQKPALCMDGC